MKRLFFACLVALSAATGCIPYHHTFQYDQRTTANVITPSPVAVSQQTLYVEPFTDVRKGENRNNSGVALIPFVPVAKCNAPKPETGTLWLPGVGRFEFDVDVPLELTKATVFSFQTACVFEKTEIKNFSSISSGYTLHGTIYDFGARHVAISYGASIFAGFAYLCAAPAGTSTNRIDIEFTLTDNTTGTTIWWERIRKKNTFAYSYYYNRQPNGHFPRLYAQIMEQAIAHASVAVVQYERELHARPKQQRTTTSTQNDYL